VEQARSSERHSQPLVRGPLRMPWLVPASVRLRLKHLMWSLDRTITSSAQDYWVEWEVVSAR